MTEITFEHFDNDSLKPEVIDSDELTVYTSNPDFTQCFQDTAFTWGPCGLLWAASLIYIPYLRGRTSLHRWGYIGKFNLLKLITTLLLAAVAVTELFYVISLESNDASVLSPKPVQYVAPAIKIVTFVLAAVYTHWTFRKGVHSSPVLFFFWLLMLITGIFGLRSKILQVNREVLILENTKDRFTFVTFCVYFSLVLVQFICALFSDPAALNPEVSEETIGLQDGNTDETTPLLDNGPSEAQRKMERREAKPCPKLTASFLSVMIFWWFTPTIVNGYRKPMTYDDMWVIRHEDSCSCIIPKFQKYWRKELQKRSRSGAGDTAEKNKPSLKKALLGCFGLSFLSAGVLLFAFDLLMFINPQILQALILFVETGDAYQWRGYLYAVGMFCASFCGVVCFHHYFNLLYTTGMRVRTALTTALYRKALKLSSVARKTATVGEIVNLMSVDTQKMQDAPMTLHFLWSSPLIVSLGMFFLWQQLGPACLPGLVFLVVVLPMNSVILAKKIRSLQREQMKLKDSRLKLMNQVLSGIKVLKLYAWEPYFTQKILQIRDAELAVLRKASLLGAVTYILWFSSPFIVALACFATYVLSSPDNVLDAQTAFVSMSLIVVLGFPLAILPSAIMSLVQAIVSAKRIEHFLLEEEVDRENVIQDPLMDGAVTIDNGQFSWGEEGRITLQDINVQVDDGQLIAVVGQVGCGKSSLLSAILGEMRKHQGTVKVKGSVAYVPQQAWIQNLTLRDNILFSKPLNKEFYDKVVQACALGPDIDILPGGDQTEIGERGINLSGGQKQRVSLARAVYQNKDIYLFDDPLSAVDAHVGKHIFEQVMGADGLLRKKTRILVTHGIKYLPKVDKVIVIKDGRISEMGHFEELLSHDGAFAEFIRTYLKETEEEPDIEAIEQLKRLQKHIITLSGGDEGTSDATGKSNHSGLKKPRKKLRREKALRDMSLEEELSIDGKKKKKKTQLIEEELTEMGAIKLSVIKSYMGAASAGYVVFTFVSFCGFIAAQCSTNIWLSIWTNDKPVNGTQDPELTDLRLGVYGGLAIAQTLSVLGLAVSIALGTVSASRRLHFKLLHNIMKCPMLFFDTTPLGRIVNRFSKDIDVMDSNIPMYTQNFTITLAPLLSTLIVIVYSIPIFGVAIVPLAAIFVTLQRVYVACARQIKRIDAVKRSPIYAFFSETLAGVSTIRAYDEQDRFIQHSDQLLDDSQRVWFEVFTSNRWVGIWSEVLGDIIILITALLLVVQRDSLDPGLVGLALSFALQVNLNMLMTVRSSCELETYIIAAERVKEYSEVPTEAAWVIPDKRPPRTWPDDGLVEFNNYQTRYRPGLELVLKGVTCSVKPMEKIGIIGRTGAGKSSMTLALFRLIEASGGSIKVDGYDISTMGLHDLRTKLTIIPQDPVLFSGSLRFNLDPSEYFTDDEIWTALQQAHLKDFILTLPETLEYECGEDGDNLSVGQRQLLCLARALLKKSKILVLDEATAAVDLETDELIQTTIRTEFKKCTILTIAHRLNTIIDYDRVIVMSGGEIKEFDTPTALSNDTTSLFYSMARDAGLT